MPGTLLITEATLISLRFGGRYNVPGIWSPEHIAGWKEVVDAVHANGCFIFCQLWALGRAGHPDVLEATCGGKPLSASALPMHADAATPAEMTQQDIQDALDDYVEAAKNAIAAGFDGVEIHGANGYLPDQFLQDTCNQRTDEWGGSIENRARFPAEVARRVAAAVGASRTAMRLSPFSDFQGMLMAQPMPQFEYLVRELRSAQPSVSAPNRGAHPWQRRCRLGRNQYRRAPRQDMEQCQSGASSRRLQARHGRPSGRYDLQGLRCLHRIWSIFRLQSGSRLSSARERPLGAL